MVFKSYSLKLKALSIYGLIVCGLFTFSSCTRAVSQQTYNFEAANPTLLNECAKELTDVIVYDIFKPPVASRVYSYAYLAAYEVMRQQSPQYRSMDGLINQFKGIRPVEKGKVYCFPLAGMVAFNEVAKQLTFSDKTWEDFEEKLYLKFKKMGIPDDVYENSVSYGALVAKDILFYAKSDNYDKTRNYKFAIVNGIPGRWVPTPPTYADACEPKWNTIRSFFLDSASQFKPLPCAAFDRNPKSKYHKLLMQVYNINKTLTKEQKGIAYFWDDNSFVTQVFGHASIVTKKMTPPGHWLAIAQTAAKVKRLDLMNTVQVYLLTSLAMHDAFIASYDEKYRSNRIRPVTVIEQSIDPDWLPFLETPSFPEYVSAHSAISAAAGTIMTKLIGDKTAYVDSTEYVYGHGVRSFTNFIQAYREVSDSRVYGGIHYRDGVDAGMKQGEEIGSFILKKMQEPQTQKALAMLKN